jgi:hypothetical protein
VGWEPLVDRLTNIIISQRLGVLVGDKRLVGGA